jgi:hypothetical protein
MVMNEIKDTLCIETMSEEIASIFGLEYDPAGPAQGPWVDKVCAHLCTYVLACVLLFVFVSSCSHLCSFWYLCVFFWPGWVWEENHAASAVQKP